MFNINNVDSLINEIKAFKLPYINCYYSTLGGKENISILIIISKQVKETWPSGILENTAYSKLHLYNNGLLEIFCNNTGNKFRKSTIKNAQELFIKLTKLLA